ncbi:MAG: TonB family protein [Bacteroidetes bacterium]|nr:TonB family protein [Bacteroidota bacterium]
MKWLLLMFVLSAFITSYGQETIYRKNPNTGKTEQFTYVDQMPEAPYDVNQYLVKKISHLPQYPYYSKVVVQFIVEKDGSISNPHVLKKRDTMLDSIAVEVIKNMPKWKPAVHNGKKIAIPYTLPVIFDFE